MNKKELLFEIIMSCISSAVLFGGFIYLPGVFGGMGYLITLVLFIMVLVLWGFIGKRFVK